MIPFLIQLNVLPSGSLGFSSDFGLDESVLFLPPGVNCCNFPPYYFAPITRLCLTFCNFRPPLRLTLPSGLNLRRTFRGISWVCPALSVILAPNSTHNTGHRVRTHNTNTENIRPRNHRRQV